MRYDTIWNVNNKYILECKKNIALVITIIVLLILAAVSIATLTGENGILTRAQDAKEETEVAEEKEAIQLAYTGAIAEKRGTGDITADDLNREFETNGTNAKAVDNGDGTITVTFDPPSNRVYTIDSNGNITDEGTSENPGGGQTGSVQPGEIVEATEKENYTDPDGDKATVPAGFVVSKIPEEQDISDGLVIYDIPEEKLADVDWTAKNDDGAYQVQTLYNQFVWIPVAEGEYERELSYPSHYDSNLDYTPDGSTYTDMEYLPEEIQPIISEEITDEEQISLINEEVERNAVMKYNGFYIARYEAGKDTDGTTVISKQDATVYTSITQTNSKSTAKTMYDNSSVKSALCSGIQWDMVMKFVDGKNDGTGEKIFDVRTYDETRHTGSKTTAGKNINDKVQNIYDLEGNCYEWVAEKNNISDSFVYRGSYYPKNSTYRASKRRSDSDNADNYGTFRPALYIM